MSLSSPNSVSSTIGITTINVCLLLAEDSEGDRFGRSRKGVLTSRAFDATREWTDKLTELDIHGHVLTIAGTTSITGGWGSL